MSDSGLCHMVQQLPALTALALPGAVANGDGSITRLSTLHALEVLHMNETRVTSDGLAHILRLPALRSLRITI